MKEDDIRNRTAYDQYIKLADEDAKNIFDFSGFVKINCPACKSSEAVHEFEKKGFCYVSCKQCGTLFVNPRPSFHDLETFYKSSSSTSFWINEFFKPVAEKRRKKIFYPRAEYISQKLFRENKKTIGDIGAGYGIFLEELKKFWKDSTMVAIEPSQELAEICSQKGFNARCSTLEKLKGFDGTFDLLTAFELLEHLFNPEEFLKQVYRLLKPGAYFLITTLNGQGFDIEVLWEQSVSINPPHHLNFFNLKSISLLLKSIGFNIIESSTPGKLDWDLVENAYKKEGKDIGRFWKLLADKASQDTKQDFQAWIVKNNLSSHMRILAQKK